MRTLALIWAGLVCPLATVHAEQAPLDKTIANSLFHVLVDAEAARDYDAFVANGTGDWKATISKRIFDDSSNLLGPRLKAGFTIEPAGDRNENGNVIYIYKLHFKDGSPDMVGTLSLKSGQIAGIVFN